MRNPGPAGALGLARLRGPWPAISTIPRIFGGLQSLTVGKPVLSFTQP